MTGMINGLFFQYNIFALDDLVDLTQGWMI